LLARRLEGIGTRVQLRRQRQCAGVIIIVMNDPRRHEVAGVRKTVEAGVRARRDDRDHSRCVPCS
jgi:hypothetical protein